MTLTDTALAAVVVLLTVAVAWLSGIGTALAIYGCGLLLIVVMYALDKATR